MKNSISPSLPQNQQQANRFFVIAICIAVTFIQAEACCADTIVLNDQIGSLAIEYKTASITPDKDGVLRRYSLQMPSFKRGVYYAPSTFGVAAGNRMSATTFSSVEDLIRIHTERRRSRNGISQNSEMVNADLELGAFICLELSQDRYMAILALAGEAAYSAFAVRDEGLVLEAATKGTAVYNGVIPGVAYATAQTPYKASLAAWNAALDSATVNHSTNLRGSKQFPKPFQYVGYCTWEHLRRNFDEKILCDLILQLNNHSVPFRWLLIDDGYEFHRDKRLMSFEPDPARFPDGWKPVAAMKSDDGIRWLGQWWNMSGYFNGMDVKHHVSELEGKLMAVDGKRVPMIDPEAASIFYETRARAMDDAGFDFIKVDFQTQMFMLYQGQSNAALAMSYNHRALEDASHRHFDGMMNCIGQSHVNVFKQAHSVSLRFSTDYRKSNPDNHARISLQSLRNSLWLGAVHWGDYDMFESGLDNGAAMAELRALAGSPFYLSEDLGQINAEVVRKACWSDGELLRPMAPITLLPDCIFDHASDQPIRAVAPLTNDVAAFWLANVTSEDDLIATLSPSDYRYGGAMLQPQSSDWELPSHLIAYHWHDKKAFVFDKDYTATLSPWKSQLIFMLPVKDGWAVIGYENKYLSPVGIKIKLLSQNELDMEIKETEPLLVWSESGSLAVEGGTISQAGDMLYRIQPTSYSLKITRQ